MKKYIDYYHNKRIQAKNKMNASCKTQGNIHETIFFELNYNMSRKLGTHHQIKCHCRSVFFAISAPRKDIKKYLFHIDINN